MAAERERLYLFDTTLRDGAQTNGVDFTLTDKLAIIRMLDELGIDYVEGGYPGANPTDTQLFSEPRMLNATFTAFGMMRRPGRSTSNDPGLGRAARRQGRGDLLRRQVLGLSRAGRARDHARGKSRLDPRQREGRQGQRPRGAARLRAFLRRLQGQSVLRAGLRQDGLRGGRALGRAVRHQRRHAAARGRGHRAARWSSMSPAIIVGIHAHNDTEQAVANSFAAVRAGARQIQGTLNGLGERCGNANLVSIIPTLEAQAGVRRQIRDRRVRRAS